jgi:hypothetical protein
MYVHALVIEKLEPEGLLRSLTMQLQPGEPLVVSFADEYDEPREGPFHFTSERHEQLFRTAFAACRARRLSREAFFENEGTFSFRTSWISLPTERGHLTYYALSLPEFGVPISVKISDPYTPGKEYRKSVYRDDIHQNYIVYLECRSSTSQFSFELSMSFKIEKTGFGLSNYTDATTDEHAHQIDDYQYFLEAEQRERVSNFLSGNVVLGNQYVVNAERAELNIYQWLDQVDAESFLRQLDQLSAAMNSSSNRLVSHDAFDVALARKYAMEKNKPKTVEHLKKAGKWALDTATQIGATVAAEVLKRSLLG